MIRRLSPSFVLSISVLAGLALVAVFAPFVAPYSPTEIRAAPFGVPNAENLLGTDALGRDLLSRTIYGLRYTLGISTFVTVIACTLGVVLAIMAAVRKGWVDTMIGRAVDSIMAIPQIIFALIVLAVAGISLTTLVCTMIVLEATLFFRILRASAGDIAAMDREASGMERGALLARIAGDGKVLRTGGGFALLRRFGRGQVVGPVVASGEEPAQMLIAAAASRCHGSFLRIDLPESAGLCGFVEGLGLQRTGGGVAMIRNGRARALGRMRTFALVSQALG